jgi:hypothetical protein
MSIADDRSGKASDEWRAAMRARWDHEQIDWLWDSTTIGGVSLAQALDDGAVALLLVKALAQGRLTHEDGTWMLWRGNPGSQFGGPLADPHPDAFALLARLEATE